MSAVRRNTIWLLLSQGSTWIVSILTLLIVPNQLGDELFGELSFALVYVSLFGLVAGWGTGEFLTKTLARATHQTGHYLYNTLVMKLIVSLTCAALSVSLGVAFDFDRQRIALIAVCCVGMVFVVLNGVLVGGYLGLQSMGRPALWNAIGLYVGGAFGIVVLLSGGGVVVYALGFNLALAIPFAGNLLGMLPELRATKGLDHRIWVHVFKGGFPFFVLSALLLIYGTLDVVMLEVLADTATVGWYAIAYRWVSLPAVFAVTVATAFFPALSAEGVELTESFKSMANRALFVVLIVAVPAATGISLIAEDFIILLYGEEFRQVVPILILLAVHIPIVGVDVVLGTVVVALDLQRRWVVFSAAAAVFNPIVNLFAIPYAVNTFENGAIGAASATVLTELLLLAGALLITPKGVLSRDTLKLASRIVIASAAMIPIVLLLGSTPLAIQVATGVSVYGLMCVALKVISIEDVRQLRTSFKYRRGQRDAGDIRTKSLGE